MAQSIYNDSWKVIYSTVQVLVQDPDTSRITSVSTTFSGNGVTQSFALSSSSKDIVAVTVGGITQSYGTDYEYKGVGEDTIYCYSPPASASNNVVVSYTTGTQWVFSTRPLDSDKAFPGYPIMTDRKSVV